MELFFFILIFIWAVLGTPIFIVMALLSLTAFYFNGIGADSVAIAIYQVSDQPTLLTVPLFTFAGHLMAESKSPERILRFAQAALGWLPGGVAAMCLVVCAIFTAFTGGSGVTIIALGGLMSTILIKEGYSEKLILGLVTTSGSLGLLFAPSLPIILYGLVAKVDVDQLFKAGVVPGIFLLVVLSLYTMWQGKKSFEFKQFNSREFVSAFKGSFWELLLPVAVLCSIYGGFTTITEAATFTALYTLVMECLIYRDISYKHFPEIVRKSMSLVGAILLILCCAMALTDYLTDAEVPMRLLAIMQQWVTHQYSFLLILNIFLLIVGSMTEIFGAIIVVVPLVVPIALQYGIHPVHFAIIFLTNLEIAYLTPPLGINLFISSFRFKKPITEVYKASLPFLFLMFLALMVITYLPLMLHWY